MTETSEPLLRVRDLSVKLRTADGLVEAVSRVSFDVAAGETVGIVGESGAGKSLTLHAVLDLLPSDARVSGELRWRGRDLRSRGRLARRRLLGKELALVSQDPGAALHPAYTVVAQVAEAVDPHAAGASPGARQRRARDLLAELGVPAESHGRPLYPHQLSGGMRQRVLVAMVLANSPRLIFADEPTSSLDVLAQADALDLVIDAAHRRHASVVLVSHDLGLVAERADRLVVLYAGRTIEAGPTRCVLAAPRHPYAAALLATRPSRDGGVVIPGEPPGVRARPPGCAFHPRCPSAEADAGCDATTPELRRVDVDQLVACHRSDEWPGGARLPTIDRAPISPDRGVSEVALAATGLRAGYRIDARRTLAAVDGLDLSIRSGEIVGLVGESGCGKSTLARALAGLHAPLSGEIRSRELRPTEAAWHGRVQIVFQNPASSLNPRRRVIDSVLESYRVTGSDPAGVEDLLARVGLRRDVAMMRPSRLSLGELQRACLARSLAVNPEVLILDEPVSSLDVSIQAQIVDLLIDLQRERGMAYLFISHDLSVVRTLATRVFVMNKGRIVESGPIDAVFEAPEHPYTRALLDAVPGNAHRDVHRARPGGDMAPHEFADGCRYRTRCPRAAERCAAETPLLGGYNGRLVACFFPETDSRGP